ncbi:CLC4A protein, partial [Rhinopomastus cyanomelas]|nr:CLC4A protein [Rhinopomastus cyanomelas]
MASEITYAEVNFKNAAPAAAVKAPPKTKKNEHHPQKCPPWLPWLISALLLLVCIALVIALLVTPSHSNDQPSVLQQNFTEWQCVSAVLQGKERGWRCCPQGWKCFGGSCYYLLTDKMSWVDSQQNCTGMGSHLVVINSEAEQTFLSSQTKSQREENYYIGLSAQNVSQWRWVDQTPLNTTAAFWREGEPSGTSEECVVIHSTTDPPYNWNDVICKTKHHRICEAAAVTV